MDEERSPLLRGQPKLDDKVIVRRLKPKRLVVVEPVIILYAFAGFPMMTVYEQYFLRKVGHDMGIDYDHLNSTNNVTCGTSLNDTAFLQREAVQAETARWQLYISLVTFLPSIISKLMYGALSDRMGRRLCFILPPIGSICTTILYLCVIHFNLPIQFFFLSAVEYCFGSFSLLFVGAFAYMADTASPRWLAVRMTIIDVVAFLSGGISQLGVGYLIKFSGYFWPLVYVLVGKVITLVYAIFFIPETVPKGSHATENRQCGIEDRHTSRRTRMQWRDFFAAFRLFTHDNGTGRQWKICLLAGSYFLFEIYSTFGIIGLYQQNAPLCWKSVMIGYYNSVSTLVHAVGTLAGLGLKKCLADHWLMVVGKVSSILEYATLLLATNSLVMFMVPVVGCFMILSLPMMRAILSRYVRLDEQASLFAAMYCISSVCELVGKVAVNNIYAATLLWYEGTVFVVAIGVKVLSLALVLIFIYKTRGDRRVTTILTRDKEGDEGSTSYHGQEISQDNTLIQ